MIPSTPHGVLNPQVCHCTPIVRTSIVGRLPMFRDARPQTYDELLKSLRSQGLPERKEIVPWRYPSGMFGVVARGAVKVFRYVNDEHYVIFDVLTEGDWFLYGDSDALGARLYSLPDQIVTMTTSCVLTMDRVRFLSILDGDKQLIERLFIEATRRLSAANERIIRYLSSNAEQKLAFLILFLFDKCPRKPGYPGLIPFNLTKQDLASMTGHTLATVSRMLTAWETEGVVRTGRGWVDVLDRDRLQNKCAGPDL